MTQNRSSQNTNFFKSKHFFIALTALVFTTALFILPKHAQPIPGEPVVAPTIQPETAVLLNDTTDTTTPSPAPKRTEQATLVSTAGWQSATFSGIRFMLPPAATGAEHPTPETCQSGFSQCYKVTNYDSTVFGNQSLEIAVKKYQGGSRRAEAALDGTFTYQDVRFGTHSSLVATFACSIEACIRYRTVITVVGENLVVITEPSYLNQATDPPTTSIESPIVNTIISTMQ